MSEVKEKGQGWMKYVLAVLSLFISFIFIRTACPTVYLGDSGEITAAAYTLGIGHPPGYPLYMMLLKIASWLPLGDVAFRANLFSSFLAVLVFLAMYFTSLTSIEALYGKKAGLHMKLAALFTACVFVLSYMFWFEAGQAKGGIYILSHLAELLGILCCLKFIYEKKSRYFYLGAFTAGFMPAIHHSMALIMIFVLLGLALNMKPLKAGQKAAGAGFFLLSFMTAYLYLFIRSKAAPVVCWGGIDTAQQVINHILRKVYSSIPRGPFNTEVIIFKLRHYFGQFIFSYTLAALLPAAGLVFIFMHSKKLFLVLLAFIVLNMAGLVYLTGYSFAPFSVYMNGGFYLIVDAVLMLSAGAGAYGLINLPDKKYYAVKTAVFSALFLIPVFNIFSFFPALDQSRKFMAYDNTMNDLRTLKPGDMIFAEEDFQVFNILYYKVVRGMFPGIRAFDRSSNFLDISVFKPFRDAGMEKKLTVKAHNKDELEYMMMQYTAKLERAAEYTVITHNPDKVYYTGIPGFTGMKISTVPYGILYKIVPENTKIPGAASLMQLYTIRDYENDAKLDLYYRDVLGRYFIQRAKYAAQARDKDGFDYYRTWGENIAGGSGSVLNLIAEIYYSDLKDMPMAIQYMEKIMRQNPYDFSALDVLINFCMLADREKALLWLKHYYRIAMTTDMQNTVLVQINKLSEELKR